METEADRQVKALDAFAYDNTRIYGSEWGDPFTQQEIIDYMIKPYCKGSVIEIGSGGGRWTKVLLSTNPRHILSIDATPNSEALIREAMYTRDMSFLLCQDGVFRVPYDYDFIFSFDTFVHFHPKLFINYLHSAAKALRKGGHFILHYACLFSMDQEPYDPVCFQYRTQEEFQLLVELNGFEINNSIPLNGGFGSMCADLVYRGH